MVPPAISRTSSYCGRIAVRAERTPGRALVGSARRVGRLRAARCLRRIELQQFGQLELGRGEQHRERAAPGQYNDAPHEHRAFDCCAYKEALASAVTVNRCRRGNASLRIPADAEAGNGDDPVSRRHRHNVTRPKRHRLRTETCFSLSAPDPCWRGREGWSVPWSGSTGRREFVPRGTLV